MRAKRRAWINDRKEFVQIKDIWRVINVTEKTNQKERHLTLRVRFRWDHLTSHTCHRIKWMLDPLV